MSGRFMGAKGLYPHSPATLGNIFKRMDVLIVKQTVHKLRI